MSRFARIQPEGEDRERLSCLECGHIFYENPKVIVGAVVAQDGQVLLCRRAIEPRRGFWTLPAGYLELGETCAEGAAREAFEEAGARIAIEGVLAIYDISRIGQVQIIHRARFADPAAPAMSPGHESLELKLFPWAEIPWAELAFPSVRWALEAWHSLGDAPLSAPFRNPPEDPRGEIALPEEISSSAHLPTTSQPSTERTPL
jgi:ADP-ribose pyrophosphatase YjhB (NUDIX family)